MTTRQAKKIMKPAGGGKTSKLPPYWYHRCILTIWGSMHDERVLQAMRITNYER